MPAKRIRSYRSCLLLLAGTCLLTSCRSSAPPYGQPDEASEKWRQEAEAARVLPVPLPDEEALVLANSTDADPTAMSPAPPPLPSLPVDDLTLVREIEIPVLLRALAKGAGINILIGEKVAGPINLSLQSGTRWDQLFTRIIETQGLFYEWDGEILLVLSQEDLQRQTAIEEALRLREEARQERLQSEPLQLALYRVKYADSARLSESIMAGLGVTTETPSTKVSIIPDADSGLLIINATPNRMQQVMQLASSLDQPARQILIEAMIVQTNSETARDLGVQWGTLFPNRDSGTLQVGSALDPEDIENFNANFPADFSMEDAGFTFGAVRSTSNQILRAQLTALQKDGRLEIISSPSITTLDKQTALIESGEERPFQSASGAGLNTTPTVEFKEALLSLEVTPQVIDGEWIKLGIKTSKDEFDDTNAVIIDGTLQVPIITRAAETLLYLADGQTTVIGGLSTQSENDGQSGIPFLKDLPLLGYAFRNTVNRSSFSDTLIFITPYILPSEANRSRPGTAPGEAEK